MSSANPGQEAYETWRKSLEEGTQAWLRALGQATVPPAAPPPLFDFAQLWRPMVTQAMEAWQKAVAQGAPAPDVMEQWKRVTDQSIEAWSKALAEAMSTEGFAQALGKYLDQYLATQAPLRKGLEQYNDLALRALGLPSRGQVVGVASQVVGLEERIEGLEDRLDEIRTMLRELARALTDQEGAPPGRAAGAPRTTRPAKAPVKTPVKTKEGA